MPTLDSIVRNLRNRTNDIVQLDAPYELIRDGVTKASENIRSEKLTSKIKGPGVIDRFEKFASMYIQEIGVEITGENKEAGYGRYMRNILGNNYNQFLDALKTGDIDTALAMAKTAATNDQLEAEAISIGERVEQLTPGQRTAWAKEVAKLAGPIKLDPDKVKENPAQFIVNAYQNLASWKPYAP